MNNTNLYYVRSKARCFPIPDEDMSHRQLTSQLGTTILTFGCPYTSFVAIDNWYFTDDQISVINNMENSNWLRIVLKNPVVCDVTTSYPNNLAQSGLKTIVAFEVKVEDVISVEE